MVGKWQPILEVMKKLWAWSKEYHENPLKASFAQFSLAFFIFLPVKNCMNVNRFSFLFLLTVFNLLCLSKKNLPIFKKYREAYGKMSEKNIIPRACCALKNTFDPENAKACHQNTTNKNPLFLVHLIFHFRSSCTIWPKHLWVLRKIITPGKKTMYSFCLFLFHVFVQPDVLLTSKEEYGAHYKQCLFVFFLSFWWYVANVMN